MMRHFGPPECPHMIAGFEPEIRRIFAGLLDDMKGKTRIDVVDEFAFPGPVTVICKVLGVPLEAIPRFHGWIEAALDGLDFGPEANDPEQQRRAAAVPAAGGRDQAVPGRPARPVPQAARSGHVVGDGQRRRPGGAPVPGVARQQRRCSCSSPGMRRRST